MLASIKAGVLRFVPAIFGRAAEGPVGLDLSEITQVFGVRDAMLRSSLERRQFLNSHVHAGAGILFETHDLWATTGWLSISSGGGGNPGPIPDDHDALILGVGFWVGSGSNLLTVANASLRFAAASGSAQNPAVLLASGRTGASADSSEPDQIYAPFLPYAIDRISATGQTILTDTSVVTAATSVFFTYDVISAPVGIIPFA